MTNVQYQKRLTEYLQRAVIGVLELDELEQEAHEEAWDTALAYYLRLFQAVLDQAQDAELAGVPFDEFKKELVEWWRV
jgi:hypothetical protein